MFSRFIFECDTKYFSDATHAAEELLQATDKQMMVSAQYSDGTEVFMFAKRLKKSIRVQQVKP